MVHTRTPAPAAQEAEGTCNVHGGRCKDVAVTTARTRRVPRHCRRIGGGDADGHAGSHNQHTRSTVRLAASTTPAPPPAPTGPTAPAAPVSVPSETAGASAAPAAGLRQNHPEVPPPAHSSTAPVGAPLSPTGRRDDDAVQPRITVVSASPRIVVVDGFLSPAECQKLIDSTQGKLDKMQRQHKLSSYGPVTLNASVHMTGPRSAGATESSIASRLSAMVNQGDVRGHRPVLRLKNQSCGMLRYRPTSWFFGLPHLDGNAATALVYLNTPVKGGGTAFYLSDAAGLRHLSDQQRQALQVELLAPASALRPGLRVLPVQGRCIVFWTQVEGRSIQVAKDPAALHMGEQVLEGEKYALMTDLCSTRTK